MNIFKHPKIYIVGGAVRDEIMGLIPNDIDYAIELNEVEFETEFPEIAKNKVGKSFPVYLHEGCEIALTRTEKSTGPRYNDFEIDTVGVSIIEDLGRRDFTINAIAKNVLTGEIVDPFNGIDDIKNKLIKTVSVNSFSEDPLRILRFIRFLSKYKFDSNVETYSQLENNLKNVKNLYKERILIEFEKAYKAGGLKKFIELMVKFNVMDVVFDYPFSKMVSIKAGPFQYHGDNSVLDHTLECIQRAHDKNLSFDVMLSLLFHDIGKVESSEELIQAGHHYGHEKKSFNISNKIVKDFPFTKEQREFIPLVCKYHMKMHVIDKMRTIKLDNFVQSIPKRYFEDFINACSCDHGYNEKQMVVLDTMRNIKNYKFSEEEAEQIKNSKNKKETVTRLLNKMVAIFN